MALFVAFDDKVEVNGKTVITFINAVDKSFKKQMLFLLERHGIEDIKPDKWYNQQIWLNAFRDINENIGQHTLFSIGKEIPNNAEFPLLPPDAGLKAALESIDIAYHMNHRGGEIGHYRLKEISNFDAVMECRNPYPSEFDRGIILTVARLYKPADAAVVEVLLDDTKPSRKYGDESCTYIITW